MYDSDIRARLGIDGTSIPGDLAKARQQFQKFGQNVEQDAAKHGDSAGGKLIGGIEHRIFGARHLSGALASALGLNIEKIAEKIASVITGGSAEAWKAAGEIADENTKIIQKIIEKNMSPGKLAEYYKREIEKANEEAAAISGQGKASFLNRATGGLLGSGAKALDAEQLKEQQEAENRGLVAQEKLNDLKEKDAKTSEKADEAQRKYDDAHGTAKQRIGRLNADIFNLEEEMNKIGITTAERDTLKIKKLEKMTELEKEQKDLAEKKAAKEKEILESKTRQANLEEHLRRARLELKSDTDKLGDRTKLTLGELADLHGKPKVSSLEEEMQKTQQHMSEGLAFNADDGLTSEQVKARDKAKQIKELEARAEQARLSGDQQGAGDLLKQVGGMRDELVSSGFTKSTQGDESKMLREQIAKDNFEIKKTLGEIKQIEEGRYVNTP